jgi:hypothetical protein
MYIEKIEVINAAVDALIEVTQTDIDNAIPMDKERCPLALSGKRTMPGAIRTQAYKSRYYVLREIPIAGLVWERYTVTKTLMIQEAIIDNGGKFSPGKYLLKAPTASKRTGKQQGSNTRPSKDPNASRRTSPHRTPMRENAPTAST